LGSKNKGTAAIIAIVGLATVSSLLAVKALLGQTFSIILAGTPVTGEIPIVIDPLSAWFILVINFTSITGVVYGAKYMQAYNNKPTNLILHWISYLLAHASLTVICSIHNSIVFLIAWEIMALSAFFMVIFEGHKTQTLRAGINYLIQSHIAIIMLTIAFIWIALIAGTFSFSGITLFVTTQKPSQSFILMLLFFVGFGIKAGFVPFHTWLPHAHPAAPSHVSGFMSGILIKIGIYGILRMVLLININYQATGYFILVVSVITGVYGVMLALVQHNLKKLLAYHSIENIGIIGIGIGIGCIGLGTGNVYLSWLGFAGALLHTLNHSLFKSLLFYGAGNIHHSTHTMSIDKLGGLVKQMPHTAFLFLIAALAICGLPPFNGFISEFIIYSGLFNGIQSYNFPNMLVFIVVLFGLTLIGGLAIFCFTKAFGSIFLGTSRHLTCEKQPVERTWQQLLPMYFIVGLIIAIGIFPQVFLNLLSLPTGQFVGVIPNTLFASHAEAFNTVNNVGYFSMGFILLAGLVFFFRQRMKRLVITSTKPTWGCAYILPSSRMQYTASSFVRNYRKLAQPLLSFQEFKKEVKGIFPGKAGHQFHPQDKVEEYLIKWPLLRLRYFMFRLSFLQNGRLQFYILYGMMFIILLIGVPFIVYLISIFVNFLNTV